MKRTLVLLCCLVLVFAVFAAPASAAGDWHDIVMAVAAPGCTVGLRMDGRVLYAGNPDIPAARDVQSWEDVAWIETQDSGKYLVGKTSDERVYLTLLQPPENVYGNYFDQSHVDGWQKIINVFIRENIALGLDEDGGFYWSTLDSDALSAVQSCQGWPPLRDITTDGYSLVLGLGQDDRVYTNDMEALYAASRYWGGGSDRSMDWTYVNDLYCTNCGTFAVKNSGVVGLDTRGWSNIEALFIAPDSVFGLRYDGTVAANFDDGIFSMDDRLQQISKWKDIMDLSFDGAIRYLPVGLHYDGTVAAVTEQDGYPYGEWDFSGWTDVRKLFSGTDFTLGLTWDGKVLATGGEFGTLDYLDRIAGWKNVFWIYPAEGEYTDHIVARLYDGTLVAAGDNSYGQCSVS